MIAVVAVPVGFCRIERKGTLLRRHPEDDCEDTAPAAKAVCEAAGERADEWDFVPLNQDSPFSF